MTYLKMKFVFFASKTSTFAKYLNHQSMTATYKQLTLATCEIAKMAGQFMAEERKTFNDNRIESKGMHDLVSYVDKASEKQIIEQLQQLLPESGFIAEEGTTDIHGERWYR